MKDKIKDVFNFFVRVGLSGALLYYIFSKIDIEKTKGVLLSAELIYIFYAFLTFIVINIIILVRWRIYIKALDIDASNKDITRYYLVGLFGNLFLPSAIGGDLIKIYGLCKGSNQKARVVASVLLDRLSGFASIVIVAVTSFVVGYKYIQN
ncbi:MAG: flippase-like domain-containing protein, partial [Candidatus Omnitrophica bacterium]|nr:flippase-like domain-containing protein [Candidatus Omnitrophota bacterium]